MSEWFPKEDRGLHVWANADPVGGVSYNAVYVTAPTWKGCGGMMLQAKEPTPMRAVAGAMSLWSGRCECPGCETREETRPVPIRGLRLAK